MFVCLPVCLSGACELVVSGMTGKFSTDHLFIPK
jgi:hypothetical protein